MTIFDAVLRVFRSGIGFSMSARASVVGACLLGCMLLIGGCRTSAVGESEVLDATDNSVSQDDQASELERGGLFVGCRRSLGECQNSCAQRDGRGYQDLAACPQEQNEGEFACYCGQDTEPVPEAPPANRYDFIGCRPSQGECLNSCPTRKGVTYRHPEVCPVEAGDGEFACFCEKQ